MPSFEGPLDLLLHFVRTRELDIRRLPIAPICHDYLEFLRACEEIDLTLSSEWLAMAARLIGSITLNLPVPWEGSTMIGR